MSEEKIKKEKEEKRFKKQIASMILDDGSIVEMVYDPIKSRSDFIIFNNGEIKKESLIEIEDMDYVPLYPNNGLLRNRVILFPTNVEKFESEESLIIEIENFIHKYLDISSFFEKIATYYVMFTWIYDCFNELPYLRALGDYGCGKTRFLQVMGSICNKPMFAGGATTTSPVFRIIEQIRGTLILDEADFRFSDTKSEIIKILNNGFSKGFPVLRTEANKNGEWGLKTFDVFCPKVIATRERFQDRALESRFLVEEMEKGTLRDDIPINIPNSFWEEATKIRNKLLWWRFINYGQKKIENDTNSKIQPRLKQIANPLLSIIRDEKIREGLIATLIEYDKQITIDRGMSNDAKIFEAVLALLKNYPLTEIKVKDIADTYNRGPLDAKEVLSSQKVGWYLRERLKIKTERTRDGYVLSEINKPRIELLKKKFGIVEDSNPDKTTDTNDIPVINEETYGR